MFSTKSRVGTGLVGLLAAGLVVACCGPAGLSHAAVVPFSDDFESPSPVVAGNFVLPVPGWVEFEDGWAAVGYGTMRVGVPGFGYPAASSPTTIVQLGDDQGPAGMYKDLGTMVAGETYTFTAVLSDAGDGILVNLYRFSFIGDYAGAPLATPAGNILASITEATFSAPDGGSLPATFNYTATGADDGDTLRLQLETVTTFTGGVLSRTGIDDVTVTTTVIPEPSTFALTIIGLLGLLGWGLRRRR